MWNYIKTTTRFAAFLVACLFILASCRTSVRFVDVETLPVKENYLSVGLNESQDIFQIRLCKGNSVLGPATTVDQDSKWSELQTLSFFICPCRDSSKYHNGYMIDVKNEDTTLNAQSLLSSRKSWEVIEEDAVSTVYFILNGVSKASQTDEKKYGTGMMIYPRKPTNFNKESKWNATIAGPMNKVFGQLEFDLYWALKSYPVYWKYEEGSDVTDNEVNIRFMVIKNKDVFDYLSINESAKEWWDFRKTKAASDFILDGDILDIVISINEKEEEYHVKWISHSFIENGSRARKPVLLQTSQSISLPLYPNVEPYFIDVENREQSSYTKKGVRLVKQDASESFVYRYKVPKEKKVKKKKISRGLVDENGLKRVFLTSGKSGFGKVFVPIERKE